MTVVFMVFAFITGITGFDHVCHDDLVYGFSLVGFTALLVVLLTVLVIKDAD